MSGFFNDPRTPEELAKMAEKQRRKLFRDYANHLCSWHGIDPHGRLLGPYLHKGPGGSNLDATVQWLKAYIGSQDILTIYIDLDEWKSAFKTELCNKIPTEFWGNE